MSGVVGEILLGWLLADLIGGLFHFVEDRQLLPGFLDRHVGAPNRLHHAEPLAVTRDPNILRRNWTALAANVPPIALLYAVTGPGIMLTAAAVGGLLSFEVHRWAHMPRNAPGAVRLLQEVGLFQSPKHHSGHHAPPQDRRYCILTDWLNPILDHFRVWPRLAATLAKLGIGKGAEA